MVQDTTQPGEATHGVEEYPEPVHIIVVGSINMDLVIRASAIPGPGQTIAGHNFSTIAGGKGANQAV
ncbi:PfkB family carbohydrate kinase, partial [Planctomycetota bacterium]